MIETNEIGNATLLTGDVIEGLQSLQDESVQCVVTSPPYWGLRDYGVTGQIGLEETLDGWLDRLVGVFREVRRVLRKDGTAWLNLGDALNSHGGERTVAQASAKSTLEGGLKTQIEARRQRPSTKHFKPKDLLMMPARLAMALQADGWWLRSEIIWSKPNPMPESVTDRPTSSHEKVYLVTRSAKYFYDADAVREPLKRPEELDRKNPAVFGGKNKHRLINNRKYSGNEYKGELSGRNLRNVWTIATQPYPEAHFATFPEALPMKCIMAGTSEHGCCPECGAPWKRIVEKSRTFESGSGKSGNMPTGKYGPDLQGGGETLGIRRGPCVQTETLDWEPNCGCEHHPQDGPMIPYEPIPCTVLDPFSGSATTGLVALKLSRRYIGIELNPDYQALAIKRISPEAKQEKMF